MFLYTTTTIINAANAVDVQGNALLDNAGDPLARYVGTAEEFKVIGTGTFKASDIRSVYKRAYAAGVKEVATLTVPTATAKDLLRLTVEVKLDGSVQSDYANFTYDFKQPLTVDILSSGTAATDATELARVLNKIKTEYGRSLFVASPDGADVILTARTNDQRFKSVTLEKVGDVPLNSLSPTITHLATGVVDPSGKTGFGDDAWMLKSVMLPTYENTRHFGIIKDERPILGGNYSQYTLKLVTKAGEEGVFMGDDKSVTTHVFWVADSQVEDFEDALAITFADIEPVGDTPNQNYESNPGGAVGSNTDEQVIP